jgi:hypothetical protein
MSDNKGNFKLFAVTFKQQATNAQWLQQTGCNLKTNSICDVIG